ncbi:zinc-ribbon domain containing protein [Actinokineospora sp.]|uniref:zinc-ribbon domain containing protein n=1 Tax=Actinokineospora sp. TaxID=1872133 RepID=UPI004037EAC6
MSESGRRSFPPEPMRGVAEEVEWPLFFHPQRGGEFGPINRELFHYRGGADSGWREIGSARMLVVQHGCWVEHCEPVPGQALPDGFLWADPTKQYYGMGGPHRFYGPREKVCRRCEAPFVFSADEQQHLYETLGLHIDKETVHCPGCRAVKRTRKAYSEQVRRLDETPSPDAYLEAARLAAVLLAAGDRIDVDKAIGYSRRAKKSGRHVREATGIEARLIALRAADTHFLEWR